MLRNLAALGSRMSFVSVIGNDDGGREVEKLLSELDGAEIHVLVQPQRKTTVKTRFIAGDRQLLRADWESATPLGPYVRDDLLRLARELVGGHDAVVLSDYAKGVLTDGVALEIIKTAHEAGTRVVAQPKGGDHIRYRGADVLTLSAEELAAATGLQAGRTEDVAAAARSLIERCAFGAVVVNCGRHGMILVESHDATELATGLPDNGFDASGTEDAAVAMLAAGLGGGMPLPAAARAAGLAAEIVGGKTGAAVASAGELAVVLADRRRSERAVRVEVAPQAAGRSQREA
ncbi:MAG: hypothetical protein JO258_21205 [Alphaproteobacteria bacterium]|nr:hypothetical protein [Alphaproteobacteria bacterium]